MNTSDKRRRDRAKAVTTAPNSVSTPPDVFHLKAGESPSPMLYIGVRRPPNARYVATIIMDDRDSRILETVFSKLAKYHSKESLGLSEDEANHARWLLGNLAYQIRNTK